MTQANYFREIPGFRATDIGPSNGKEGKTGSDYFGDFISLKRRGERVTVVTTITTSFDLPCLKLKATIDIANEFGHGLTETAHKKLHSSSWTPRRRHRSSMTKRESSIYQKYQGQGKRFTMKGQDMPETLSH